MRPTTFLISCVIAFVVMGGAWALLVDRVLIPDRELAVPFTQFLLESTAEVSGKVVIDSGSNSTHGIDTLALSDYFQAPVIIVADGASYALRNKIFNLEKYLNPDDVLILPLEWHYYGRGENLAKVFLSSVMNQDLSLEYYFNSLPFSEKLRFTFTKLPLKMSLETLMTPRNAQHMDRSDLGRLHRFEEKLNNRDNESYGGSLRDGPEDIHPIAAKKRCDKYILPGGALIGRSIISQTFRENLKLMQRLSDKGVKVYFTWPAVADKEKSACYSLPGVSGYMEEYAAGVVDLVEASGFQFVGDFKQGHYGADCFLNTYYHLRYSCAEARTAALINALRDSGIGPLESAATQESLTVAAIEFVRNARLRLTGTKDLPGGP